MRGRTWIWGAGLVFCTGLIALLCEHFRLAQPLIERMHVLFGLATSAAISVLLIGGARHLADRPAVELYRYTRLVSRSVYIFVYVLGIVRVGMYFLDVSQARVGHIAHLPAVRPVDDFQFYVACCIVPLWLVRAFVLGLRSQTAQFLPHVGDQV